MEVFSAAGLNGKTAVARDQFLRLTGRELSVLMPGSRAEVKRVRAQTRVGARECLEAIIARHIQASPFYVLFSGGRDSSGLLAVATHVARLVGAPDPIPVTGRHRHAPRSDESTWQDLVISHLRLRERIVFDFSGEQSLLAPDAQDSLRQHGLLWPPDAHVQTAYFRRLDPGVIVAGQGGDLMISARRATSLAQAWRGRHPRRVLRTLPPTLLPRARRSIAQMVESEADTIAPWLTAEGRRLTADLLSEGSPEPLAWSRGVRSLPMPRNVQMGVRNLPTMARMHGHTPVMPYEEDAFIDGLARDGGFWGLGDRTDVMRYLFRDLLPDEVLRRSSKAAFNEVRWDEREREFARSWSGAGIDDRYIDPERLRDSWLTDELLPMSAEPLHAAWLADNEIPAVPV